MPSVIMRPNAEGAIAQLRIRSGKSAEPGGKDVGDEQIWPGDKEVIGADPHGPFERLTKVDKPKGR